MTGWSQFPGTPEQSLLAASTIGAAGLAVGVALTCTLWWLRASHPVEVPAGRG